MKLKIKSARLRRLVARLATSKSAVTMTGAEYMAKLARVAA